MWGPICLPSDPVETSCFAYCLVARQVYFKMLLAKLRLYLHGSDELITGKQQAQEPTQQVPSKELS